VIVIILTNFNKISYQIFISLFFLDAILTPITLSLAHVRLGAIFFHGFKISFIALFILLIVFHLKNNIRLHFINKLFIFYLPIVFLHGVYVYGINYYTFSHAYGFLIAVLGLSFGQYFIQESSLQIIDGFKKKLKYYFWILGIILTVYMQLYFWGVIEYFGMSSMIGYFSLYFLSQGLIVLFLISILLILFSGKRTVLLSTLLTVIMFYLFSKEISWRLKVVYLSLLVFMMFIAAQFNFLDRFQNILLFTEMSSEQFYSLTGGRLFELKYLFSFMSENIESWYIGAGFGAHYLEPFGMNDYTGFYYKHYSHFSPMYLAMIYGAPFSFLIYFSIGTVIWTAIRKNLIKNWFVLVLIMLTISSFAGSTLFVDIKFWIFLGITIALIKNKRTDPSI